MQKSKMAVWEGLTNSHEKKRSKKQRGEEEPRCLYIVSVCQMGLIECLMNYAMRFVTLYRRQGSRQFPWKRNAKKQNAV